MHVRQNGHSRVVRHLRRQIVNGGVGQYCLNENICSSPQLQTLLPLSILVTSGAAVHVFVVFFYSLQGIKLEYFVNLKMS